MKWLACLVLVALAVADSAHAQPREVSVKVSFKEWLLPTLGSRPHDPPVIQLGSRMAMPGRSTRTRG